MHTDPLLSFIIGGRNDQHMGNFKWRFETALNYLGANLDHLGRLDDVEVVVTDWGSEVPLHEVLSLNLAARRIVRFILVPPALAQELEGDAEFPIVLVQNTAVRRSRGKYIAQTDSDILFTTEFLGGLFDILDGRRTIDVPVDRSFLFSGRRNVPWRYVVRNPNIGELDWFIQRFGRFLPAGSWFSIGERDRYTATGFVMMHKKLWYECRGYDERLIHWGWMDIDLALRVKQKCPWMNLEDAGLPVVFHLEHYHPSTGRRTTRERNPMRRDNQHQPNEGSWGIGAYSLQESDSFRDLEDLGDPNTVDRQKMHLTRGLLFAIIQVVLTAAWQSIRKRAVNQLGGLLPGRVASLGLLWRRRIAYVWQELRDQPVKRWPRFLKMLWKQRQISQ